MPVHTGKDSKGCFAQWGSQKKYYYTCGNTTARKAAKAKAAKQGAAARAAGFRENEMIFQKVVTNFTGNVRNDTMEGRDFLVAPMIMMVEGVHEGSEGPLYYPATELQKTPAIWNHKPVVVYHPQERGQGVSACDPDILTNRKVGVIMNTTFEDGKLKAEAWLEVDRMNKVDERIATAIENNETMELSTGLFTDNEEVEGEWNGESYIAIARNYRPDHLALLPDIKGACSIEDGAGFLRLNEEGDFVMNPAPDVTEKYIRIRQKSPGLFKEGSFRTITVSSSKGIKAVAGRLKKPPKGQEGSLVIQTFLFDKKKWTTARAKAWVKDHKPTSNEMSHGNIRSLLNSLLRVDNDELWVEEVYDDFFIYEHAGTYYKQNYKEEKDSVSFEGEKEEVTKVTEYRTKSGSFIGNENNNDFSRKEKIMNKSKIVDALIKNESTQWAEDDKESLMELSEDILNKMSPVMNEEDDKDDDKTTEDKAADNKASENADENKGTSEENPEEKETTENMTAEDYIAKKVPAELKEVLRNGLSSYKADKARLIAVITANKKSTFTKEQLEAKGLEELKAIATLASNTEEQETQLQTLNYVGQGDAAQQEEETPMEMPTMNFGEKKTA